MARRLIGEVSHYFTNIGVAVLELTVALKQGETIEFEKRDRTWGYKQKVSSMELEHKRLKEAKKGMSIGMKVNKPLKKGFRVYKVAATTTKAPAKKTVKKTVKKTPTRGCKPPKRKCPPKRKGPSKKITKAPAKKVAKRTVKKVVRKPVKKVVRKTTKKR